MDYYNGWGKLEVGYTTMYANPCPHCPPGTPLVGGGTANPAPICTCPTNIYIPPGSHIHVSCPVHGQMILTGGSITTL